MLGRQVTTNVQQLAKRLACKLTSKPYKHLFVEICVCHSMSAPTVWHVAQRACIHTRSTHNAGIPMDFRNFCVATSYAFLSVYTSTASAACLLLPMRWQSAKSFAHLRSPLAAYFWYFCLLLLYLRSVCALAKSSTCCAHAFFRLSRGWL